MMLRFQQTGLDNSQVPFTSTNKQKEIHISLAT